MAQISVFVDGIVRINAPMTAALDCLSIDLDKDILETVPVARDTLYLHGNVAEVRAFAQAILAALPMEVAELPAESEVAEMPADYQMPEMDEVQAC